MSLTSSATSLLISCGVLLATMLPFSVNFAISSGVRAAITNSRFSLSTISVGVPARRQDAGPVSDPVRAKPSLDQGRNVRQRGEPRLGIDRERPKLLGVHIRPRAVEGGEAEIHASGDEIRHHRRAAAIMDVLNRRIRGERNFGGEQMAGGTGTRRAK